MINVKRIILLAIPLLVIGLIGMAATFTTYKESAAHEESESISFHDNEINEIEIDAENTEINLQTVNEETARVEYTATGKSIQNKEFNTSIEGEKLIIHIEETSLPFFHFDFLYFSKAVLDIYVPEDLVNKIQAKTTNAKIAAVHLQTDELKLHTSNGKIEGEDLETTSIDLQSSNGRIALQDISGEVKANTTNAKISLHSVQGDTNLKTRNGKITLQDISGEITARTNNAAIMLTTQGFDYPMNLETNNGKINITSAKKPENATFDLRTHNGKIRVFDSKDWDITYGNGETLIKAQTGNGGIRIE